MQEMNCIQARIDRVMPIFENIENDAARIVANIGGRMVGRYMELMRIVDQGPVSNNCFFTGKYIGFYRICFDDVDMCEYFNILEEFRTKGFDVDVVDVMNMISEDSLQFSFATKLMHTIKPKEYPIYDLKIGRVLGYRLHYKWRRLARLDECLGIYNDLCAIYECIIENGLLENARAAFHNQYGAIANGISEIKVIDFILWSAGGRHFNMVLPNENAFNIGNHAH